MILLSAQGRKFDQAQARELATAQELLLICGRYEGVDERVAEHLADEEVSIGDFVLSGGELARGGGHRHGGAVAGRRAGQPGLGRERIVRRGGRAGLPAVYAAGGVSRLEGAGDAAQRQPRGDPEVAAEGGAGKDGAAAAGFVGSIGIEDTGNESRTNDQDLEQEPADGGPSRVPPGRHHSRARQDQRRRQGTLAGV